MPDALRALARDAAPRAHAPYTRRAEAVVLLLSDGVWVPGVRVENASFPLLIPPLTAAYARARAAGRADVIAAASTVPFGAGDAEFLADGMGSTWHRVAPDLLVAEIDHALPTPTHVLSPFLDRPIPTSDAEGVALATEVAAGAWTPASHFPVGCVLETADGRLVPGVNVEHADWTRGLCAERVALATALAHGVTAFRRVWVACPLEPGGTPCGACRQVLFELAPGVPVVLARGDAPPETTTPEALLPGGFRGDALRQPPGA